MLPPGTPPTNHGANLLDDSVEIEPVIFSSCLVTKNVAFTLLKDRTQQQHDLTGVFLLSGHNLFAVHHRPGANSVEQKLFTGLVAVAFVQRHIAHDGPLRHVPGPCEVDAIVCHLHNVEVEQAQVFETKLSLHNQLIDRISVHWGKHI